MLQRTEHTVLLIEADRSLRRLIALGLQYRGMHVIEACFPTDFREAKIDAPASWEMWLQTIFESQQPDVIVLDIDSEAGSDHVLLSTIQSQSCLSTLPMVVLAWDCQIHLRAIKIPRKLT